MRTRQKGRTYLSGERLKMLIQLSIAVQLHNRLNLVHIISLSRLALRLQVEKDLMPTENYGHLSLQCRIGRRHDQLLHERHVVEHDRTSQSVDARLVRHTEIVGRAHQGDVLRRWHVRHAREQVSERTVTGLLYG